MSVVEREQTETTIITEEEVRERAAWYLEEFGWCQEVAACNLSGEPVAYNDPTAMNFCILGAWWRAADEFGVDLPLPDFGLETASECAKHPAAVWNDKPGRTRKEVIERLRA